ncbi:MAG: hypothetical protein HRT67_11970 [Flavobacteriaceae bacterium]|nr:hypothetical protein [Flavobacteriaceae bacterium]
MTPNNFCLNEAYHLKTNNEFICDEIIEKNINNEFLIVNSLSRKKETILLPRYKDDNIFKLKKSGILPHYGISDLQFLKFIIDNETTDFNFIVFGLAGLSYESVTFLKNYFLSLKKNSNKIFLLIDYDSSNDNFEIQQIKKDGNELFSNPSCDI